MRLLLILFCCLLSMAISRSDELTIKHELPKDPKTVIIQYDHPVYIEGHALPRSGPDLQILADGTVVVHDPFGRPPEDPFQPETEPASVADGNSSSDKKQTEEKKSEHVKRIASNKLKPNELQKLLSFIIDEQKFFDLKVDNRQLQTILADADNTMITVQNIDGRSKKHVVYGLGSAKKFATDKNGLVQMWRIHKRLMTIRADSIRQARKGKPNTE